MKNAGIAGVFLLCGATQRAVAQPAYFSTDTAALRELPAASLAIAMIV